MWGELSFGTAMAFCKEPYVLQWRALRLTVKSLYRLLTFKRLHGLALSYLSALQFSLRIARHTVDLPSSGQLCFLNSPLPAAQNSPNDLSLVQFQDHGTNCMAFAACQCSSVDLFKVALETHLFTYYFNIQRW